MDKIIRRPDPIQVDPDGTEWWNFLFSYRYEDKHFEFAIPARSEDEAKDRLRVISSTATYDGQQHGGDLSQNEFDAIDMTTVGQKPLN